MASNIGKLVACNKCGNSVFLAKLFAPKEEYQDPPKGWVDIDSFTHLCPKCARELKTLIADFFNDDIPDCWNFNTEDTTESLTEDIINQEKYKTDVLRVNPKFKELKQITVEI